MLLLKWLGLQPFLTPSGLEGYSAHDQANDVVDVDGLSIKNAITYFSHVWPVMLICGMYQAGQGLLYSCFDLVGNFR